MTGGILGWAGFRFQYHGLNFQKKIIVKFFKETVC